MHVLAPGFADQPELMALAVELSRLTFPYLLCISLMTLLIGMLQSSQRFMPGASAPILLNICLISALLFGTSTTTTASHMLAYGVIAAGVTQLLFVAICAWKSGILPTLSAPKLSPEIRLFFRRLAPGLLGAGITQINLWIDVLLATFFTGAVAYLYYADRIVQLPLALIGTAMGTVLLPALSASFTKKDTQQSQQIQTRALLVTMLLTLPAAAALATIPHIILSSLFERGEFTAEDVNASAQAMTMYAFGLPAFALQKLLTTPYFAMGDTKTPVKIAVITLVTNLCLNLSFIFVFKAVGLMPHAGLAAATSLSAWLSVALLYLGIRKRGLWQLAKTTSSYLRNILISVFMMAAALQLTHHFLPETLSPIISLCLLVTTGIAVYLPCILLFKLERLAFGKHPLE